MGGIRFWAVSAEVSYGNDTGWNQQRAVVVVHPIKWAEQEEARYRCVVRLLHWEQISSSEANSIKRVLG